MSAVKHKPDLYDFWLGASPLVVLASPHSSQDAGPRGIFYGW